LRHASHLIEDSNSSSVSRQGAAFVALEAIELVPKIAVLLSVLLDLRSLLYDPLHLLMRLEHLSQLVCLGLPQ
jgi:hypothetical protein